MFKITVLGAPIILETPLNRLKAVDNVIDVKSVKNQALEESSSSIEVVDAKSMNGFDLDNAQSHKLTDTHSGDLSVWDSIMRYSTLSPEDDRKNIPRKRNEPSIGSSIVVIGSDDVYEEFQIINKSDSLSSFEIIDGDNSTSQTKDNDIYETDPLQSSISNLPFMKLEDKNSNTDTEDVNQGVTFDNLNTMTWSLVNSFDQNDLGQSIPFNDEYSFESRAPDCVYDLAFYEDGLSLDTLYIQLIRKVNPGTIFLNFEPYSESINDACVFAVTKNCQLSMQVEYNEGIQIRIEDDGSNSKIMLRVCRLGKVNSIQTDTTTSRIILNSDVFTRPVHWNPLQSISIKDENHPSNEEEAVVKILKELRNNSKRRQLGFERLAVGVFLSRMKEFLIENRRSFNVIRYESLFTNLVENCKGTEEDLYKEILQVCFDLNFIAGF